MSRREDVHSSIWSEDDDFLDLSPDSKLLYLWSFTNDHCNPAGFYRVGRRVILNETGLSVKRLDAALAELAEARFLFYEDGALWIRTRAKHLWSQSPNHAKSIVSTIKRYLDHPLVARFLSEYRERSWLGDHLSQFPIPEGKEQAPRSPLQGVQSLAKGKKEGGDQRKQSSRSADELPTDFPPQLKPFVAPVKVSLTRISALRPGAIAPTTAAVARALASFPDRDFLPIAEDYEHWLTHGTGQNRRPKDPVQGYRNQLRLNQPVSRKTQRNGGTPTVDRTDQRLEEASR